VQRRHIDMLEYRADQQETTVSGVLAQELDGIGSAHIEELSAAFTAEALERVHARFLLADDLPLILGRAGAEWDLATK
jgi:hypothetical protein